MTKDCDFLTGLNDSQREAVEYCDGPSLVIAGAGSGKTRVLTYKIAYLLTKGIHPWNILALTFTNKAASEMKSRISSIIGDSYAHNLNMGTFHSVFSRILRVEAERIGYDSNYTIYDDSDSRNLVKTIVKEMELDDKLYKPSSVYSRISMAKNHLILPEIYANDKNLINRDIEAKMPCMSAVYSAYCNRCKKANAMDFDDLLVNTYLLFNTSEEIRLKYAARFKYILVDEYQDTNSVQQKIVWQLSQEHRQVCAVGDDAQSIYAFRGANIDNILNFQQIFKDARLFKLERNYRSTQNIVKAANSLIKHNQRQIPKDVYSRNDEGEPIVLKPAYSDREEAIIVCNEIKRIRQREKCGYGDFAILYRTNSQSRSFEEAMLKVNIPYRIYGGLAFYQRKEIKDIMAYFRMVVNPNDEEAFKRVINYPKRGIGNTTVAKIAGLASIKGMSFWHVISSPEESGLSVSKSTMDKLGAFQGLMEGFINKAPYETAYDLGMEIIKSSGISADVYSDMSPENVSRQQNIEEFLSSLHDFVAEREEEGRANETGLSDFLQEVSLQTDINSDTGADGERVALMTVHSAKGLEFPTVFIVGLEENIFPSMLSINSKRALEEERRLLYVAITRAEKHCFMTYAKNRYRYGRMEIESPSRFLEEISPELIRSDDVSDILFQKTRSSETSRSSIFANRRSYQNSSPVATQFKADMKLREVAHKEEKTNNNVWTPQTRNASSSAAARKDNGKLSEIHENCVIEHDRFGIGTIIRLEGVGENMKATVKFRNAGVKQLLLKFARFKVIG